MKVKSYLLALCLFLSFQSANSMGAAIQLMFEAATESGLSFLFGESAAAAGFAAARAGRYARKNEKRKIERQIFALLEREEARRRFERFEAEIRGSGDRKECRAALKKAFFSKDPELSEDELDRKADEVLGKRMAEEEHRQVKFARRNEDPRRGPPGSPKWRDKDAEYHTFRKAGGHYEDDTLENRKLLKDVYKHGKFEGYDKYGNEWYSLKDGDKQRWLRMRNGQITNGGFNVKERSFDPSSGLCEPGE